MSLSGIVRALGGDLYAGGQRANIPGPGHSRHDRSVSLLLANGRVVVHSFGRSTWQEVCDHLRDQGLIDRDDRPLGSGLRAPAPCATRPFDRIAIARALWAEAAPIEGSLSRRHLELRGALRASPVSPALRHHAAAPSAVYEGRGRRRPALLAAISGPDGALTAVEITYLDPWGSRTTELLCARKIVGSVPAGSAVRLDAAGPELLVGEGVFTTLSASGRFDRPGWALLSTGNLRQWTPPEEVRDVLIAGDRGQDGERSASVLARRLRAIGHRARVVIPPWPSGDWNEAALAERQKGGRVRAGEGAS